jgi:hypothetical protein
MVTEMAIPALEGGDSKRVQKVLSGERLSVTDEIELNAQGCE